MSRALLDSWGVREFAPGMYPERFDPRPNRADNLVNGLRGRIACSLSSLRMLPARTFARKVLALEPGTSGADEAKLRERVAALRAGLASDGMTDDHAAEAFALVRELCHRRLGLRHYPVQIMGGHTLLQGGLAEMMTGEGKTLTAVLPAVAVALAGVPVHVVTVNSYLARRDSEYLAPIYQFFGLSVGLIEPEQEPPQRVSAYRCDVTYCVNKDLVFDYLRDRIAQRQVRSGARTLLEGWLGNGQGGGGPMLLRGLYYAIVDEADSVLIDEARTPLIISAEHDDPLGRALYEQALALARSLKADEHFVLRVKERSIELTEAGRAALAAFSDGLDGLWQISRAREEIVEQGLSALHLYALDRHYILADGKIQIVDEYTGRVMPDRSWEKGLHQMVEVKEGAALTKRRDTISRITYQRYFRRYLRLAGMSGTVAEVAPEMRTVYGLDVLRIPPNRPVVRHDLGIQVFATSARRWDAVRDAAQAMAQQGRAVLIGTRSVAASELIGALLTLAGLRHAVLNARQDAREADIVAAAGQPGRITVATNMAGRGTDILLAPAVRDAGGLHVILTEYHDSARIDRQLFGRAGRQGDPGSCEALVSLEDELFRSHAPALVAWLGSHAAADGRVSGPVAGMLPRVAQRAAERQNARIRRQTLDMDNRIETSLAFAGRGE